MTMRPLVIVALLLLNASLVYCAEAPIRFEYCTTDFAGVVSNGNTVLCYGTHGNINRSTDRGLSWQRSTIGNTHDIIRIDTVGSQYVGVSRNAVFVSDDNAAHWKIYAMDGISGMCHRADTVYLLTRKALWRAQLSQLPSFIPIAFLDTAVQHSRIIATDRGTLHWIEDTTSVASYFVATGRLQLREVLDLALNPLCKKVDGLRYHASRLYLSIIEIQSSIDPANPDDELYSHFIVSTDLGLSWTLRPNSDLTGREHLDLNNFEVVNDSQFIALRWRTTIRSINIPDPSGLKRGASQGFQTIDFTSVDANGYTASLNPSDTVPERYTVRSAAKIASFIHLDDTTIIAAGSLNCIVRSTNRGKSWNYLSYYPSRNFGGVTVYQCVSARSMYFPDEDGAFYKTTDSGATILPQRFRFYTQYINSGVALAHYDDNGNGSVIIRTGLERDSNVFVTHDYGETYTLRDRIRLFNAFARDSINRTNFQFSVSVGYTIETGAAYLVMGKLYHYDTAGRVVSYPNSLILRFDRNFRFLDSFSLPVNYIRSAQVVGTDIYLVAEYGRDLGYKTDIKDLKYPSYAIFRSTNDGLSWDSLDVAVPAPHEYYSVDKYYAPVISLFNPNFVVQNNIVFCTGISRLLQYDSEHDVIDTMQLPFRPLSGLRSPSMIYTPSGIVSASVGHKFYYTQSLQGSKTMWDSTEIPGVISLDTLNYFNGFYPYSAESGFATSGVKMAGGSGITYRSVILRYSTPVVVNAVEQTTAQATKLKISAFPQPTRGPLSIQLNLSSEQCLGLQPMLLDLLGNTAAVLHFELTSESPSSSTLRFDCSELSSGVYYLQLGVSGPGELIPIVVY